MMRKSNKAMILPLLLVVLLFGSLLAGLSIDLVESTARNAQIHINQLEETNEGISLLEKGRGWLVRQIEEQGNLPRWFDSDPTEEGLLSQGEWNPDNHAPLRIYSEVDGSGSTLEVLDLDYRAGLLLEGAPSLPPCFYDRFSLFGGTGMVDTDTGKLLVPPEDLSVSGDLQLSEEKGGVTFSGSGEALILFTGKNDEGNLSSPNEEVRLRFCFPGNNGPLPKGLDIGFRLSQTGKTPETLFSQGYSLSFSIEDPLNPENRDSLILRTNGTGSPEKQGEIIARIPFPYCRSLNVQDQERYRAYLADIHEVRLDFSGDAFRAVLDEGKGTLEKDLESNIDAPSFPSAEGLVALRVRSLEGTRTVVSSLRLYPEDERGYFLECRRRGYYLVRGLVRKDGTSRVYESILSADLGSGKIEQLAWRENPPR